MIDWLGIGGLVITTVGAGIAWVTWVNPLRRMSLFMLNKPKKWEKRVYPDQEENTQWVFTPNPAFRIHWGKILVEDFGNAGEFWLPSKPKGTKNISFEINIVANGVRLLSLIFVGIDDLRMFVPLPQRDGDKFFYSKLQIQVGGIISYFQGDRYKNLKHFAKKQGIDL